MQYFLVDVFADRAFQGASVHVFINDCQLTDQQMAMITEEFHAVDSVFVELTDANVKQAVCYFGNKKTALASHNVIAATQVLANHCQGQIPESNKLQFIDAHGQSFNIHVLTGNNEALVTISQTVKPLIDPFVATNKELALSVGLIEADIGFDQFKPLVVDSNGPYLILPIKSYNAVRAARVSQAMWLQSNLPEAQVKGVMLFSNNTDSNTADFHTRLISPEFAHHLDPAISSLIPGFTSYLCAHSHIQKGTHSF